MSWVLAFLGFAVLIILHELGHYSAAKAVGMRVERFSLFFGPALAKVRRGETEYAIGSIPLGGYVKITGMNPDEARELPQDLYERSYAGSPVWKRLVVIGAGPLVNLVIAFVLLLGIFWHEGKAVPGTAVKEVETSGASAQVLQPGDRLLSASVRPTAGSSAVQTANVDGKGQSFESSDARGKALTALIASGGCNAATTGKKNADGTDQRERCATPATYTVTYVRAGKTGTAQITPRYDDQLKRYRLGVAFGNPSAPIGPVSAAGASVTGMWDVTKASVSAIVKVVYDPEARKDVSSVVGGYETTRQAINYDTVLAIQVIALISLSLAIINLFPFLPLDGGHIFWALLEKARGGKAMSTATLEKASIVGFALVIMLFLVGLTNDIGRIVDHTGFGVPSK